MSTIIKAIDKPRLSVKAQTLATVAAIAGAVLIPQVFHLIGAASGLGTALGEAFADNTCRFTGRSLRRGDRGTFRSDGELFDFVNARGSYASDNDG